MPRKNSRCGIYSITTPNGSQYIGSSYRIECRWYEHKSDLRRGSHHSKRLQSAWNKHGDRLKFDVLEECGREDLNHLEQKYIDELRPRLNTSYFVENVWCNPSTRMKFRKIHNSDEWKKQRSEIASRHPLRVAVDCSDGRRFESLSEAASQFGVRSSRIHSLIKTQRTGRLGVRFKRATDEWLADNCPIKAQVETRKSNGYTHSAQTRQKISAAHKGKPLSTHMRAKALEATQKSVVGRSLKTGKPIRFKSQRDAARAIRPLVKSASCQISKACSGVKKSAYGFVWHIGDSA